MEGVGARLGRSSARYAPTTVFSGPVRRWKKKWVPLSNRNSSNSNNNNSHLLLFKWTPITPLSNGTAAATPPASVKDASGVSTPPSAAEELPPRKFRYIPVSVLEQKLEVNVKSDDESKPDDVDASLQPAQFNDSDGKTDRSDALMDEAQVSEKERAQTEEARETNLDLRLGLKAHDDGQDDDSKIVMASSTEGFKKRKGTN